MLRTLVGTVLLACTLLTSTSSSPRAHAQAVDGQSGVTVLFFQSQNCPPCSQLEPLLETYYRQGWDIRKVDAPGQLETARQFQIKNLPTLVLLSGGREVDRLVGLVSENQLRERFSRLTARSKSTAKVGNAGSMVVRGQSPANASSGFPMLASTSVTAKPTESIEQAIARATDATVRIKVEESNTTAFGTGTIVATHQQEALILTCGHLFRDMLPGSHLKVDLFAGTPRQTTVLAQLIDFKADKEDIGLLSVQLPVAIDPVPILPRGEGIKVGQQVFSIGCDHGNNPTRRDTRVTHVNRYLGPSNIEIEGAPAVGRSGGGLFDSGGRLIGVCNAACNQDNEGIYAAEDVIYQQLSRIDHAHLFSTPTTIPDRADSIAQSSTQQPPVSMAAFTASPQEPVWPDEASAIDPAFHGSSAHDSGGTPKAAVANGIKSGSGSNGSQSANGVQVANELPATNGVQVICVVRVPGSSDRVMTIEQAPDTLLNAIEQLSANAR